jgi:hypothetical protein
MHYLCTMRAVGVFLLAMVIFFSSMSRGVVVADYLLNRDYIAKILCINRDKPEMKCNGKCHLAKQLKKQDAAEGQSEKSGKTVRTLDEVNVTCENVSTSFSVTFSIEKLGFQPYTGQPGSLPIEIDHPPC